MSRGAEEAGQFSAAINAEKIRSALGGLTIDRRENINTVDQMTRDQIVARLDALRKQYPQAFQLEAEYKDITPDEQGTGGELLNTIRQNLPKKCFATRIENKHGGGVPDIHMIWDHIPLWIELKTVKNNAVKISPHQIAWYMAYYARGGASFSWSSTLSTRHIYLFEGCQGPDLLDKGPAAP